MPSRPDASHEAASSLLEVWLCVPARDAELAAAVLDAAGLAGAAITWPFAQGEDFGAAAIAPEAPARVSVYVGAEIWPAREPALVRAIARMAWSAAAPRIAAEPVPETDWRTAWHEHFPLIQMPGLTVRPSHLEYAAGPGEVVVAVVPGLAFGTGQHESTRLCLEALAARPPKGGRVLDFGCGSGILACAAALLGAARVDAVDVDPLAVEATQANVALNGLGGRVHVAQGEVPPAGPYDLILANLTASLVAEHAAAIAAALAAGGRALCSGVVAGQAERVTNALAGAGLVVKETTADGEWRAFDAARPARVR